MSESKNFKKVRDYYNLKLWSLAKVKSAVGKWITEDEYEKITGASYAKH